jgi:hypothetical protein
MLGRIAIFGLGVGVVSLALAYALGGRDAYRLFDRGMFAAHGCSDGKGLGERRLVWTGGDSIDIALPARVRLRGGEGNDILVRGAPDVVDRIELRGSRLLLDCRFGSSPSIDITLPGRAFRRISIAGSAKLDMESLDQPELAINISGSGSVRGQGSVDRLSIKVSGSGDAKLADLAMKQLTLKISGSGSVEAGPRDEADISISGSGNIRLLTRPTQLRTHISGSGRITQVAEATEGKK